MHEQKKIPFSRMRTISGSGVFIKGFGRFGDTAMKPHVHRDDYYLLVVLTDGSATVEVDFERKKLTPGSILIVSPWQVHGKPEGAVWQADGWMLAFSPELLSEAEARIIEEYAVSPFPFSPGPDIAGDIAVLCSMLRRYRDDGNLSFALASAIKSFVVSTLGGSDKEISGRYRAITVNLRKLLDKHLASEKRPSAYASMLNISEVYLNEAVKGATGLSAGAYIRSRVIVQAKRQLAYTSVSAKEIAFALGYQDYAYFSRLFSKTVGVSPADFRKNLK